MQRTSRKPYGILVPRGMVELTAIDITHHAIVTSGPFYHKEFHRAICGRGVHAQSEVVNCLAVAEQVGGAL